METLLSEIGRLSRNEKVALLDALWEDLESDTTSTSLELTAELQRRSDAYQQDPSSVIPWEQVKARLADQ